jgi:hypothetical protein
MKRCCGCKETKSKSEFHKNKSRYDGVDSLCKVCKSEHRKKDRLLNKNHETEVRKRYREKNKERIHEIAKRFREKNKETLSDKQKNRIASLPDGYVKQKLKIKNPPKELIEFKRDQLKLHRLIKELENEQ